MKVRRLPCVYPYTATRDVAMGLVHNGGRFLAPRTSSYCSDSGLSSVYLAMMRQVERCVSLDAIDQFDPYRSRLVTASNQIWWRVCADCRGPQTGELP